LSVLEPEVSESQAPLPLPLAVSCLSSGVHARPLAGRAPWCGGCGLIAPGCCGCGGDRNAPPPREVENPSLPKSL